MIRPGADLLQRVPIARSCPLRIGWGGIKGEVFTGSVVGYFGFRIQDLVNARRPVQLLPLDMP